MEQQVISVIDALNFAKRHLESVPLCVIGEVSELSEKAGYKAVYFSIKDDTGTMKCHMWNNRYYNCGHKLKIGDKVILKGRFTIYAQKGTMDFDVTSITPTGEGYLRAQVLKIAERLHQEGLMDESRKLALPSMPLHIGLVTSPRGAAVHDVLRTLKRRFPLARISFAGVGVEGNQAPAQIMAGLQAVINAGPEVILLVRGGGSFEDLMPFNDEALARMIAASPIPIVTGIGHEPDNSIADMVASRRASTPTAAAEMVVPDVQALLRSLDVQGYSMNQCIMSMSDALQAQLESLASRPVLSRPEYLVEQKRQRLSDMAKRLTSAGRGLAAQELHQLQQAELRLSQVLPSYIERKDFEISDLAARLVSALPMRLKSTQERFGFIQTRLSSAGTHLTDGFESNLALVASRLEDLSPLRILSRGFSVARTKTGTLVSKVSELTVGQELTIQFSEGSARARVEEISK